MAKQQKSLRIEEETIKAIEKQAKKEQRKFNAMVDIILGNWVESQKKKKA